MGNGNISCRILAAALAWYKRYGSVQISTPRLWIWELRARRGWHGKGTRSRKLSGEDTAILRVCVVILLFVMSAGPVVVSECQCMTAAFVEIDFYPATHKFV